ncbi:putative ankyrin-3 isoform X11 [Rosellinia necatrix]|uniref:Putative ankyrin-3 isoform X11 n=1 Tax=Rosellinia necatrix TaxID=77044 RepID=A0A1S8ABX6_ROSNE|nr:putative ankyrin-3 isoform X11 [Rosellinia necatrix]
MLVESQHFRKETTLSNKAQKPTDESGKTAPELKELAQENNQYDTESKSMANDVLWEVPANGSQYQPNNHDLMCRNIYTRISALLSDKSRLSMAMIISLYLNPEASNLQLNWTDIRSWVGSMSELQIASRVGLNWAVKDSLERDPVCISAQDQQGNTPLHEAAKYGFRDIVCTLLSADAPLLVKNQSGMVPADFAMHYGHDQIFILIFEKMANKDALSINVKLVDLYCKCVVAGEHDRKRRLDLALFHAVKIQNIGIVLTLLNHEADPNGFNNENIPVLHYAIRYDKEVASGPSLSRDFGPEILRQLIYACADPAIMSRDTKRESALHVAMRFGKVRIIKQLIWHGADPKSIDAQGRPPLFALLDNQPTFPDYDYYGIMRCLGFRITNLDQADNRGYRILHLAAQKGLPNVLELFIKLGATINAKDASGETPLDHAKRANNPKSVELLESYMPPGGSEIEYKLDTTYLLY